MRHLKEAKEVKVTKLRKEVSINDMNGERNECSFIKV